jgi:hypothetical protein
VVSRKAEDAELCRFIATSNIPQSVWADDSGYSRAVLSLAVSGKRPLSKKLRVRLSALRIRYNAVQAKFPNVPVDFTDRQFRHRELAQLGEHLENIPQVHGTGFRKKWCGFAGMFDEEFCGAMQFSPQILNAAIVTEAAQDWTLLGATHMERILERRPFPEYVSKHGGDRRAALTALANQCFAEILASEGRERVFGLMAAMLKSGELRAASQAATGKN